MERNASSDPSAAAEMRSLGLMGVPAFKYGEESFTGLDLKRIKRLIPYTFVACPSCKKRLRVPKGQPSIKITCPSCEHKFILKAKIKKDVDD